MNKIITFKNVAYKDQNDVFIKNFNFDLITNQNVIFVAEDQPQVSDILVNLITGIRKPNSGEIKSHKFDDKRYFIGYNNFQTVLSHGAKVKDIINTLVHSQKQIIDSQDEVDELIRVFNLEKYDEHATTSLPADVLVLLNFLMLLIVKPRLIIVKQLKLPGSENFQSSSLKYIYNYTKKHDISIVTVCNDKLIENNLIDRKITISNGKIIEDFSINYIPSVEKNEVDNKTKKFDLEEDLLSALNNSFPTSNLDNQTRYQTAVQTPDVEQISIVDAFPVETPVEPKAKTVVIPHEKTASLPKEKTVVMPVEETVVQPKEKTVVMPVEKTTILPKEKTVMMPIEKRVTSEFIQTEPLENIHFNTSALETNEANSRNTDKFNEVNDLVKMTTKRLVDITKQLETIDESETHYQTQTLPNKTKQLTVNFEAQTDEFKELSQIKSELEQQIKSPEFVNLSVELQAKVFDNYDCANRLIKENIKNRTQQFGNDDIPVHHTTRLINPTRPITKQQNFGMTSMIMQEENEIASKTNRFTNKLPTSVLEEENEEIVTKHPTTHMKTTRMTEPMDDFDAIVLTDHDDVRKNTISMAPAEGDDFLYFDNEKQRLIGAEHLSNKNPTTTAPFTNDTIEDAIDETVFENFTSDLDSFEPSSNTSYTTNFTATHKLHDEPTHMKTTSMTRNLPKDETVAMKINTDIFLNDSEFDTNGLKQTAPFTVDPVMRTTRFNASNDVQNVPASNPTRTNTERFNTNNNNTKQYEVEKPKTKTFETPVAPQPARVAKYKPAKKQSSKLSMIEKLYLEALSDISIIQEQKSNKN